MKPRIAPGDNRVRLELRGCTVEQVSRLYRAFQNDQHVHLADVFGSDVWKVLSARMDAGPNASIALNIDALHDGFVEEPKDKFGNKVA